MMMRTRVPLWMVGACTAVFLSMPVIADVKQTLTSSKVDVPSLGYVVRIPDPTSGAVELRAMLGVPGAARFSEPIALPDGVTAADVAPGQDWVLALRATEVLAFQPSSAVATSIARLGQPSAWAFSPSGNRLALFYPDRGNVVLMSGLPASPKLENTLRIAQMDNFALSDNGAFAYVSGGRVLTADGGLIYAAAGPVAFESGRDLLVIYDSNTSSLMEVAATGGSSRVIGNVTDAPDQLFAAADLVYAGSTAAGTVASFDYSAGLVSTQNVKVTRISPTSIKGTVVVSFDGNEPAWLINAIGVSFVPAVQSQQGIQ